MNARAYYNEHDPKAAAWLRELIRQGHIAYGDVDERSIVDVRPDHLRGFTQCHFFAGIGGWSYAARLAGWPDERPIWTGSCPCQPFSVAGKGHGQADERHLWPEWFRLIRECRPAIVFGEQVAAAIGKDWLDGVFTDLEGQDYACGAVVLPACAVDAPHRRDRLWFVADAHPARRGNNQEPHEGQWVNGKGQSDDRASDNSGCRFAGNVDHAIGAGLEGQPRHGEDRDRPGRFDAQPLGSVAETGGGISHWRNATWLIGADNKARRVEPGIRLLAHGVSARVGLLRGYGNAIVPQVAAQIIKAMNDRPATVSREASRLALLNSRCGECSGYGYIYSSPFNPSEKPQRITCPVCNGEGFVS